MQIFTHNNCCHTNMTMQKIPENVEWRHHHPLHSPYASLFHLVLKHESMDFKVSFNYRKLSCSTIPDSYPVPHIHDFASRLQDTLIFSKINQTKVFHQISMDTDDIPKTAVTTPSGVYKFVKMPFSLRNAIQTFQHLIDKVLLGLPFTYTHTDNIMIVSNDVSAHKQDLHEAFQRLSSDKFRQMCLCFVKHRLPWT